MKLPAPNRIAVYVASLAGVVTALLPVVTDLGLTQVASVLGGLLAVTAALLKFLDGWQAMEKAEYQARLIALQDSTVQAAQERESALIAEAGAAGRKPRVTMPR